MIIYVLPRVFNCAALRYDREGAALEVAQYVLGNGSLQRTYCQIFYRSQRLQSMLVRLCQLASKPVFQVLVMVDIHERGEVLYGFSFLVTDRIDEDRDPEGGSPFMDGPPLSAEQLIGCIRNLGDAQE